MRIELTIAFVVTTLLALTTAGCISILGSSGDAYTAICYTEKDKILVQADDPKICDARVAAHLAKEPSHAAETIKTGGRTGGGLHDITIAEQWGRTGEIKKPNQNHKTSELAKCMLDGLKGDYIDGWCELFYKEVREELLRKHRHIDKLHFTCAQHLNDHHTIEKVPTWKWVCADHVPRR